MKNARLRALWALTRGLLAAVAATLAGMLLLAAAVIYLDVTDGALAALNAAFFRHARMENVSACLLLGAGLFLRAALPGGEKRA